VIATLVVGCGPSFNYNGEWRGNRNLNMPEATKEIAFTLGRVVLTIKDNRFDLNSGGAPTTGSISYGSDGATLHPEMWMGQPLSRQPPEVQQAHPDLQIKAQGDALMFDDPMAIDHKALKLVRTTK
jgi:hypothetical protein